MQQLYFFRIYTDDNSPGFVTTLKSQIALGKVTGNGLRFLMKMGRKGLFRLHF